jgi:hypothetical protein
MEMNRSTGWSHLAVCAAMLLSVQTAIAQQRTQSAAQLLSAYSASREVSVQGTVVSFAENSAEPGIGPRVALQTSSGLNTVDLGNLGLLEANHLTLNQGDSVRVVGENVAVGGSTQFLARLLQKGNQTIALRSTRGFPLRPTAARGESKAGAL